MSNIYSTQYTEIARYDSIEKQFMANQYNNFSCMIDANTGQLTLINSKDETLPYTEIIMHAKSGISEGDDIIHDVYRLIRLSTHSSKPFFCWWEKFCIFHFQKKIVNCTNNITINGADEPIELECSIEYEFFKYEDLDNYQPMMNFTFYVKENNLIYTPIDQNELDEIQDYKIDNHMALTWKRSIIYRIKSIQQEEHHREYACIIIPDTVRNDVLFQDQNRVCQIKINIKSRLWLISNEFSILFFLFKMIILQE